MRVDFSDWYVDQPGLLARQFVYSEMAGSRDLEMQVLVNVEPGPYSVQTFVAIKLSDFDLPRQAALRLSLQPMDGMTAPEVMSAIGMPEVHPRVLIKLVGPDDARKFVGMFSRGKEMHFGLHGADGEPLMRLPLPNDSKFWTAYSAKYDQALPGENKLGLKERLSRIFLRA